MADEFSIQQIRGILDQQKAAAAREIQPASPQAPQGAAEDQPGFAEMLKESIAEVNDLKIEADQAIQDLATGRSGDLQETIMAVEKADLNFRLMMEVRNKIISAYQEVMRTQV